MEKCNFSRYGVMVLFLLCHNLVSTCFSLNHEGMVLLKFKARVSDDPYGALQEWNDEVGSNCPCSWFGVECSDDHRVVALNLKDLCLRGTLAPEIRNLVHLKSIILRNNLFTGVIPEGFGELKELEVLDLGCNNFSGSIPYDLASNLSLLMLLLDNNDLLESLSPEIHHLEINSESQVHVNQRSGSTKSSPCNGRSVTLNVRRSESAVHERKLQRTTDASRKQTSSSASAPSNFRDPYTSLKTPPPSHRSLQPNMTRRNDTRQSTRTVPKEVKSPPSSVSNVPIPSVNSSSSDPPRSPTLSSNGPRTKIDAVPIIAGIAGVILLLLISVIIFVFCKIRKTSIKPWATGLSGQLQKAFVTGVPKLKRPELEAACEDFSNVIGSSPLGTLYKGTLSSGVEIAVASVAVPSAKDWCRNLEAQFRKKIETLSKINHKNFVNLIGYCEEQKPLTRMMVFEYAPNGTLFEHLHVKESEHLNWAMRLRIAMGVAYCLEHMHQLNPPLVHTNLRSSDIHLTEDYAAKISDFSFTIESTTNDLESSRDKLLESTLESPQSNVYSFGELLFEIITARLPHSVDKGSFDDWVSDYLNGGQPLREMVDPTLESFEEEKLERIGEVIRSCLSSDPSHRLTMAEVSGKLKEILAITPDAATPKLSPLWWAELEITSADAS